MKDVPPSLAPPMPRSAIPFARPPHWSLAPGEVVPVKAKDAGAGKPLAATRVE